MFAYRSTSWKTGASALYISTEGKQANITVRDQMIIDKVYEDRVKEVKLKKAEEDNRGLLKRLQS